MTDFCDVRVLQQFDGLLFVQDQAQHVVLGHSCDGRHEPVLPAISVSDEMPESAMSHTRCTKCPDIWGCSPEIRAALSAEQPSASCPLLDARLTLTSSG